jgi:hypothetical protein
MRRLFAGDLPESGPSFGDILEEFRLHDSAHIPDADSDQVREYVIGVHAWEARAVQSSPLQFCEDGSE